jgi:hypothetical protein
MYIKAIKEKNLEINYRTKNILQCVDFWNREGVVSFAKNKTGEYGNDETKKMALTMEIDDFLLEMLLRDCRAFCGKISFVVNGQYECGRTRSHVWVHANGERVLMLASSKLLNNKNI